MKKSPNNIDRHVGARLRVRRMSIAMSQEKLGDALGLTFQQVQKYEKGTNRIGASRLQQIGAILGVPPAFFFEDMPDAIPPGQMQAGFAEDDSGSLLGFLSSTEGLALTKSFVRIKDPKIRRKIIDLVFVLAGHEASDGHDEAEPTPVPVPDGVLHNERNPPNGLTKRTRAGRPPKT